METILPAAAPVPYPAALPDGLSASTHLSQPEDAINTTFTSDILAAPGSQPLVFTDATTGCFATPEPAVAAGVGVSLRETGGQFVLGQNFPNPHEGETTIPFTLTNAADVRLDLFDPLGRKVAGIVRKGLSAGEHRIPLNLRGLGLPAGDYSYQLQVATRYGTYRQRKLMTAAQ